MDPVDLTVRQAEPADLDCLAALLLAADRHYWGDRPDAEAASRRTVESILSTESECHAVLGLLGNEAIAFATYAILHPGITEHGTLFMKDLFVCDTRRGSGAGQHMMRALAEIAVKAGCARFDWTAETGNPRALAFYDRLMAERIDEKIYFRFAGDGLRRFAGSGNAKL
ncbi:MAG: GNAT family N-acetyltransferase [Pseudomonadota bacterium]